MNVKTLAGVSFIDTLHVYVCADLLCIIRESQTVRAGLKCFVRDYVVVAAVRTKSTKGVCSNNV